MSFHCKGYCTVIAKQQEELKKKMFQSRQRGTRPRNMSISAISKYCKMCDIRFYLVDYTFCKCCGCKLRSRTFLNCLSDVDKEKSKWSLLGAPTA